MRLPATDLEQRSTVRLIPTAFYKPPILRPLVDSDEEFALLAQLEGMTNERLRAEVRGLDDLDPRELAYSARERQLRSWGHTFVNAAFAHTRPDGNRFNDARRGAWYAAFDDLTAIEEVAFHRTRELAFVGRFVDEARYVAILADIIGSFPDLRGLDPPPAALATDPATGYPAGQDLALTLRAEGAAGLIYPSVRHAGGTCFVAFEPQIVQNPRPGAQWQLTWTGAPEFTVTGV